jgi:hypothetical protein
LPAHAIFFATVVRILRKLLALVIYATLLLPGADYRLSAWMRAVEITSTALDRTMRRRKSQIENERFARHLRILQMAGDERGEKTLRIRCV